MATSNLLENVQGLVDTPLLLAMDTLTIRRQNVGILHPFNAPSYPLTNARGHEAYYE